MNTKDAMAVEDSNTKKVYFKESDGSPKNVMVVESSPTPSLSWKDMLLGIDTPVVCFKCGCYRHSKENYPVVINSSVTEEKWEKSEQTIATSEVAEDGESGPWMLVELRSRRGTLDGNKKGNNPKWEKFFGSR